MAGCLTALLLKLKVFKIFKIFNTMLTGRAHLGRLPHCPPPPPPRCCRLCAGAQESLEGRRESFERFDKDWLKIYLKKHLLTLGYQGLVLLLLCPLWALLTHVYALHRWWWWWSKPIVNHRTNKHEETNAIQRRNKMKD